MTEGGSLAGEPPSATFSPCRGFKHENQEERTSMRENSATDPSVSPPADTDLVDDWEAGDDRTGGQPYRVVYGADRTITDTAVRVYAAAIQLADGSIDQGAVEEPSINISDDERSPLQLNVDQARELAATLLETVRVIEGWVTR